MHRTYLYIVIPLLATLVPMSALAAMVSLTAQPVAPGVGDTVAVTVSVSTTEPLNTFSGTLAYDPAVLSPVSISDGGSVSTVWLARPKPAATSTPFTGFAPGGFVGAGDLFTETFTVKRAGAANVSLGSVQFLRNDGQGTEEPVTVRALTLTTSSAATGGYAEAKDVTPPEAFSLELGHGSALYNGASYLAFAPIDKGSGMDRIEAGETRWPFGTPKLSTVTSPYELKDQYLTSRVVVRAYDRAGNERTVVFPRQHLFRAYELEILGTLAVALLIWLYLRKRSRA